MILSVAPIGEYDKRVVILTKEKGKISAFAKGARRPNSPLAGACTPCNFGKFMLYEGRNSNTLQSAEIENYFAELRTDVEAAYYAFYFLEFADFYTREANDEREMLKLLYQTMRVLTKKIIPFELVRYIFELKALSVSVKEGGLVCSECGQNVYDGMRLNTSTLYAMQFIVGTPVEKLYTFTLSDEVLKELGKLMGRYLDVYVAHRFKSLEILEQLTGLK